MSSLPRAFGAPAAPPDCLAGGGEMGGLSRAFDWAASPLGPPGAWPQSLKTSVSICLNSQFALVIWWGPELVFLYNDGYIPVLGDKHPDALGRAGRTVWPEIWPTIGPMLARVVETGAATWNDDLLLILERRGYPEECYFTFSYSAIRDESGGVGGVFTAVLETTEKVLRERRLRTLRELAEAGEAALDRDAVLRSAAETLAGNPFDLPFSLLYRVAEGGSRAVQIAASAADWAPREIELRGDSASPWSHACRRAMRAGAAAGMELAGLAGVPAGAWRSAPRQALVIPVAHAGAGENAAAFLVCGVSPHRALDAEYRGFLDMLGRELSGAVARADAYEMERTRADKLAEIDRAKTSFFTNISHEFRTPLTLILEPLAQLAGEGLAAAQREQVAVAQRNARRLLRLVNSLLNFSRIEAGRIRASYRPTALGEFTADIASVFRSGIERAGLRFVVECPEPAQPVYVDRDLWEQVVLNLVSNAFKFTLAGEIAVRQRAGGRGVELEVRDTGVGIPADAQPCIFERFYRVDRARGRSFEGSGIGLSLVRELVQLHGGEIDFSSREGAGTTFRVRLPFGRAHLPAEQVDESPQVEAQAHAPQLFADEALGWAADEAAGELDGRQAPQEVSGALASLLVVDDNADMRAALQRALAKRYRVRLAGNGREALDALRREAPDLLLADVMMPELDGYGLLEAVRADPGLRALPVILISARAGDEERAEGLAARADDYIVKPFRTPELLARIDQQLALAALRREVAARERDLQAQEERLRAAGQLRASEQALRDSESKLRVIFERAPLGIGLFDPAGHFLRANAALQALLGYSGSELRERTVAEVTHEADWPRNARLREELLSGQRAQFVLVKRLKRRNGALVWTRNTVAAVPDDTGVVRYTIAQVEDITEQMQAEARLREASERLRDSEQKLRAFLEHSPAPMFVKDPAGRYVQVNCAFLQSFGLEADKVLGRTDADLFPAEEARAFTQNDARVLETGSAQIFEETARYRDGPHISMVGKFPIPDAQGAGRAVGGIAIDITERKRAERALQESRRMLARAQEIAGLGYWEFEPDSDRVTWSDELCRIMGVLVSEREPSLEASLERIHVQDRERVRAAVRSALEHGAGYRLECRILRPGGEERVLQVHCEVIGNGAGGVAKLVGTCLDITEQRHAADALRQSAEQLQALSRRLVDAQEEERRRVAAELHDRVGQNVTALGLNLQIIRSTLGRGLSAKLERRLDDSLSLLEATANTISDVMAELRPPLLDEQGIGAALGWHATQFEKRTGIRVEVRGDGLAGPSRRRERDLALFRIVQEALNNVLKHARARRVEIVVRDTGDSVELVVRDDGVGFDPRGVNGGGQRLGMRTMRERAVAVQGELTVDAAPGRGTTLTVCAPH